MNEVKKSDAQATHTPVNTQLTLPTPREFNGKKSCRTDVAPLPRTFEGKLYYGAADVAKIIGVDKRTVLRWNSTFYFDCPLFTADVRAHDNTYLYEVERVLQLKSVYRSNWTRGSYEPPNEYKTTLSDEKQKRINEAENFFNLLYGTVMERKFGYLWTKKGNEKKTYPFTVSNATERKDMAVKAIELNDAGFDVYYGVNLLDNAPASNARAKHETVTLQTASIADIDIEGGTHISDAKKKYPPTFDVAKSFLPFNVSLLVDSGYGMHGLCLYSTPIEITAENRAQAKQRNQKFISVIRERADKFSKAVDGIGDLARVLRVPGTRNYKLGISDTAPICHVVKVNDVRFTPADLDEKLNALAPVKVKSKPERAQKKSKTLQLNSADKPTEQERAIAMLLKIPCAEQTYGDWIAVGMILKTNGNNVSDWEEWSRADDRFKAGECESKWKGFDENGTLTIATLHKFARDLYGYSEKDFQREWYQLHPELSTPTANDDQHVRTRDQIKDCPVDLIIPDNFLFGHNGITYVVPPKKEGGEPKYTCIARTPIVPVKILYEPKQSKYTYLISILNRGVWRTTEIAGRVLADPHSIITLADNGALIDEPKFICRFLNAIISLNPDLQETKAYSATGWTDDNFTKFAYPGIDDCIIRRAGFDFDKTLTTRGNAELWKKKFIEVADKGGAISHAYIGTALSAILARPLNIMNPQAHLLGTSGGGKTALQKFTASIFGNPLELMRNFAATNKNRQLVAAAFCDLPTFYDELETIQSKAVEENLSNDVYNFADGKGNQANKRDGTARETFRFGGARLTTGERPILKQHDLRGAYKRLLQFTIHEKIFDDDFATELHTFSELNFGHYSLQWIQFAKEHMQEIQTEYQHFAKSDPTTKNYEPTHLKTLSASLVAFEFFKVMLGVTDKFDDAELIRDRRILIDSQLPTLSQLDDTARALESLTSFVASHEKYFLRNQKDIDGKEMTFTFANETYGKIFDTGEVAFFPTALKKILEDELKFASSDKLIAAWFEQDKLVFNDGRKDHVIKIAKKTYKVIHFKANIISTDTDSAEISYYESLGVCDS